MTEICFLKGAIFCVQYNIILFTHPAKIRIRNAFRAKKLREKCV